MLVGIGTLLGRAGDILRSEGLGTLLGRGVEFVGRWLYQYDEYIVYEHTMKERDEAAFLPRMQDFTFAVVHTNEEADELAAKVGVDFRRRFVKARTGLDRGAVAFCVFSGGEVAHIGWIGMSEEAKSTFDDIPYKVDFANGEACTGGTVTVPEYRGKGLMAYGYFKRFQYLGERGIRSSRNVVVKGNAASHKVHAKFSPRVRGEARYIKLLGWKYWKEMPAACGEG